MTTRLLFGALGLAALATWTTPAGAQPAATAPAAPAVPAVLRGARWVRGLGVRVRSATGAADGGEPRGRRWSWPDAPRWWRCPTPTATAGRAAGAVRRPAYAHSVAFGHGYLYIATTPAVLRVKWSQRRAGRRRPRRIVELPQLHAVAAHLALDRDRPRRPALREHRLVVQRLRRSRRAPHDDPGVRRPTAAADARSRAGCATPSASLGSGHRPVVGRRAGPGQRRRRRPGRGDQPHRRRQATTATRSSTDRASPAPCPSAGRSAHARRRPRSTPPAFELPAHAYADGPGLLPRHRVPASRIARRCTSPFTARSTRIDQDRLLGGAHRDGERPPGRASKTSSPAG